MPEPLRLGATLEPAHVQPAIGLIESGSIARGFELTDWVLKQAPVDVLWARPVSPGRFVCLFTGEVEAVEASLGRGLETVGDDAVDRLFIPRLHRDVLPAIRAPRSELAREIDAVGVIETRTVASAVGAADAAAKTGHIALLEVRLAMHMGGKGFVTLTGELSDAESGVEAGAAWALERGALERTVVIPKPAPELSGFLLSGAGS